MALVIVGVLFMGFAALRAQIAYARRFDGVGILQHFVRGAVLYAVLGTLCFVAEKAMP